MSEQQETVAKKPKMTINETPGKTCAHWLQRKKRLCKMSVAKGRDYCGEHEPVARDGDKSADSVSDADRITCPLDPKHTVYRKKLQKHLKICNARQRDDTPAYIVKDINAGEDSDTDAVDYNTLKLHELDDKEFYGVIEKIKRLYNAHIVDKIETLQAKHKFMDDELAKEDYGKESRKHLLQTAALLGILDHEQQLRPDTSYIEFGAGKGQLAYYMVNLLQAEHLRNSQMVLLDRMSLRHKKDNKLEDRTLVQRIRVDIADLKMDCLEVLKQTKRNVAFSKHLCGAATDLTLRCVTKKTDEEADKGTEFIMIAVCCHHRCEWRSYVGKEFLQREDISKREFAIITKMVSWAICGTGLSRERRKALAIAENEATEHAETAKTENADLNEHKQRLTREEREEIGFMSKRVLDHGRLEYLRQHGYEAALKYYVPREVTLENVCLLASRKT